MEIEFVKNHDFQKYAQFQGSSICRIRLSESAPGLDTPCETFSTFLPQ